MSTDFRYFPLIAEGIVNSVRNEYDTVGNLKPAYDFGTYLELTRIMKSKDKNIAAGQVDVKYPLIWLVWEANENTKNWIDTNTSYNLSPRFFICTGANTGQSGAVRYTSNFIGILHPILTIFKSKFNYNPNIGFRSYLNNDESEHLLWGESLGYSKKENVLFDTLDAIEIKFNNLVINKTC